MQKGEFLEILVSLIEETLKEYEFIEVKHDQKIKDKDGIIRQIDVLVEVDLGSRLGKQKIIVECKDRKNKAKLTEIDGFLSLIQSVNASKGIFVSRAGFQKGAKQKAEANSEKIALYDFKEIDDLEILDWLRVPFYSYGYNIDVSGILYSLTLIGPQIVIESMDQISQAIIYRSESEYIGKLGEFVLSKLNENSKDIRSKLVNMALALRRSEKKEEFGKISLEIKFNDPHYLAINNELPQLESIKASLGAKLFKKRSNSISINQYRDISKETPITDTLVADFDDMKIAMIGDLDGGKSRIFIVTKEDKPEVFEIYDLGIIDD